MTEKKLRAFGLDAVTIVLFTNKAGALRYQPLVRFLKTITGERISKSTGEIIERVRYEFKIRNLSFVVTDSSIWVTGSLATYLHGNNIIPAPFDEIPLVLTKLRQETGIDFSSAIVYSLELSSSISMQNDPAIYTLLFEAKGLYRKNRYDNTVYIQTESQKKRTEGLRIYSKSLESNVPGNILRVEWRIVGHVAQRLELPGPLRVEHLCDPLVWNQCVGRWKKHSLNFVLKPSDNLSTQLITGLKSFREAAVNQCVRESNLMEALWERIELAERFQKLRGTSRKQVRNEFKAEIGRKANPECLELRNALAKTATLARRSKS